jgi:hypothetical protein
MSADGQGAKFHPVWPWTAHWKRGLARHFDGWIELEGRKVRPYDPYEASSDEERQRLNALPFTLAEIRTVDQILDFVGQFGLLGSYPEEQEVYREPVEGWLATARELSYVLIIAHLVRRIVRGNREELVSLREGLAFVDAQAASMPESDLLLHADLYVSARVSHHLRNSVAFIVPEHAYGGGHGLFRMLQETRTPFDHAYWRVGVMLSTTVPWLRCANPTCGMLFEQLDPRQQYCSSACSARMRQRRVRGKQKAGGPAAVDGNLDGKPD